VRELKGEGFHLSYARRKRSSHSLNLNVDVKLMQYNDDDDECMYVGSLLHVPSTYTDPI
jgi:hypothetical protein